MAAKSNVVSGMGVALSVVQSLVDAVRKSGGNDDDIHRLTVPGSEELWYQIGTMISNAGILVEDIFTLMVDYTVRVEDAVFGERDSWTPTTVKFPLLKGETGKKEIKCRLFRFAHPVYSDVVIQKMKLRGCRPASLRELLAFGRSPQNKNQRLEILALMATYHDIGGLNVAGLFPHYIQEEDRFEHHISVASYMHKWYSQSFLGVVENVQA